MELSRWGFSKTIQGVQYLDEIYDILAGKLSIRSIGWKQYWVWEDGAVTPKVEELQTHLKKSWYNYRNYVYGKSKMSGGLSESDYNKLLEEYKEEEKKKEARQKAYKQKQEKKANADRGIYGIYCNKKLVYIGKTDVDFKTRFQQHKSALEGNNSQYLYKYLRMMKRDEGCVIELKPLVNVKELKVKGNIRNRDIEAMELALIHLYQPICNIQGIKQDYEFTYGG